MKIVQCVGTAALVLAGMTFTNVATAEEASDIGIFSASVSVASDYRFRGITQNDKEATPEFGLNWAGAQGFYAGTWLGKIDWGNDDASYETDVFIGKHTDLYGTDLNTELYYYSYPDYQANAGKTASMVEGIVQLTHAFGPLTLTGTGAFSPDWSLGTGLSAYGAGTAAYTLTDWLSLSGTVGYQHVKDIDSSYVHWDLGATATWKAFALDLRYIDTNLSKADCLSDWMVTKNACAGGFSAMLTYNIAKLF
jgi:uncharacterized protein (TIGR02001 family)